MTLRTVVGRLWLVILLLPTFGLLAATCLWGGKDVRKESRMASVFRGAPAAESRRQNPFGGESKAVLAGKKLFRRHCASCHGENAEGHGKAPPLRSGALREVPDGVLFWFLRKGKLRSGMPSWSGLPPQQRWQIVSFLKSLR